MSSIDDDVPVGMGLAVIACERISHAERTGGARREVTSENIARTVSALLHRATGQRRRPVPPLDTWLSTQIVEETGDGAVRLMAVAGALIARCLDESFEAGVDPGLALDEVSAKHLTDEGREGVWRLVSEDDR